MTRIIFLFAFYCFCFYGCHAAFVTRFDDNFYPPTSEVKVYSDITTIPGEYIEIGYIEAKGGLGVSKQTLLADMKEEAKKHGADALIKIEFFDRVHYNKTIGSFEKPGGKAVMIRFMSHISK